MDLVTLFRLLLRRWPVVLPVLAVTVLAGGYLVLNPASSYATTGLNYLATVPGGDDVDALEPLSPETTADALASLLSQPSVRSTAVADGVSGDFSTSLSLAGSVITLDITAPSAELASATAEYLVRLAPQLLEETFGADRAPSIRLTPLTRVTPEDAVPNAEGAFDMELSLAVTGVPLARSNPFPPGFATIGTLIEVGTSEAIEDAVLAVDPTATYSVTQSAARDAPLLVIAASASSPETTVEVYEVVLGALEANLTLLQDQANVPAELRTEIRVLLPPSSPIQTSASTIRPLAGIVVVGGALAVGLALAVESYVASRRKRPGVEQTERHVVSAPLTRSDPPDDPRGTTVLDHKSAGLADTVEAGDTAPAPVITTTDEADTTTTPILGPPPPRVPCQRPRPTKRTGGSGTSAPRPTASDEAARSTSTHEVNPPPSRGELARGRPRGDS